jgi:hypothetical protein
MKGSTIYTGVFLVPFVVSLVAGGLWYKQAHTVMSYEKVDLAVDQTPHSLHVEVSGVVRGDRQITVEGRSGRDRVYQFYAPVVSPNWNGRTPVTYFVKADGYTPQHDFGVFPTLERGLLRKMPIGFVAGHASNGLIVVQSPLLIDTDDLADVNAFVITFVLGVPVSLLTGVIALFAVLGDKQAIKRSRTPAARV